MLQSHFSTGYHAEPYLTADIKFTRDAIYSTEQAICRELSWLDGLINLSSGSTFNSVSRPYPGQDLNL